MRTKIEVAGGAVILILLSLYGYEQYQKAVANQVATVIAQYDREADAKLDARLKQMEAADKQRQQDYEAKTASLQKLTPQQIVVKLPEYVPQATQPVVTVTKDDIEAIRSGRKSAPLNEGDAIVPQADIKPIAQALLDGNKCAGDLAACSTRNETWQEKYQTKSDEAAQWQKAAKGGSVWSRVGKDILKIGAGVGIGYALSKVR